MEEDEDGNGDVDGDEDGDEGGMDWVNVSHLNLYQPCLLYEEEVVHPTLPHPTFSQGYV